MEIYDVCVIGAGIVGSSTAFSLAKRNKNVLLLEQFHLPHTRGSSHGQTRGMRCTYQNLLYSQMSLDAHSKWRELEKEAETNLMHINGILTFFSTLNERDIAKSNFNKLGITYEEFSGQNVKEKYPMFNFPSDSYPLYEHNGGVLLANKCVLAVQNIFKQSGGLLVEGEAVQEIIPGGIVTIKTRKREYQAKSVVIAAGCFTENLIKQLGLNLPLQPHRVFVGYYAHDNLWRPPVCNFKTMDDVYGIGYGEYPGLIKICNHGGKDVDISNPDIPVDTSAVTDLIKKHIRGINPEPSIVENCLYTVTPDNDFIIDVHPDHNNIIIGAGFSGTGFKMAPITGEILADLSLNLPTKYDIKKFAMSRFENIRC